MTPTPNLLADALRKRFCEVDLFAGRGTMNCGKCDRCIALAAHDAATHASAQQAGTRTPAVDATPAQSGSEREAVLVAWNIPEGKALTVTIAADRGDKLAEKDLALLTDNTVTNIMRAGTESYFHRLRLAVAEQPELIDKISVFLLNEDGTCTPVGLSFEDELRWPKGFLQENLNLEERIQEARHKDETMRKDAERYRWYQL